MKLRRAPQFYDSTNSLSLAHDDVNVKNRATLV
jgi:hypothetical protein